MAGVYSQLFLSAKGQNGVTSYAVPLGYVAVIRDCSAYADVTGTSDFFLEGDQGQTIWWNTWDPLSRAFAQWKGRQVIPGGASITANAAAAPTDGIDYAISGYLLSI